MILRKKVKDDMIPIDKYAVIDPDATLAQAVVSLRGSYCSVETGFCTETGPRAILVVDSTGTLVGVIDFKTLLKVLIPEVHGKLSARLEALGVSIAFAEAGSGELDEIHDSLAARVRKNAQVKAKEIMLKNVAHTNVDDMLLDAMKLMFRKKLIMLPVYDDSKLVGVVRDADLFLTVADILINQ